jgi:hypothetical protein
LAVTDDLQRLSQQDVVYLMRFFECAGAPSTTEVLRGRVRQALDGTRVFNASIGQNGVVGVVLGAVDNSWGSSESPQYGLTVSITRNLNVPNVNFSEWVTITTLIPAEFAT